MKSFLREFKNLSFENKYLIKVLFYHWHPFLAQYINHILGVSTHFGLNKPYKRIFKLHQFLLHSFLFHSVYFLSLHYITLYIHTYIIHTYIHTIYIYIYIYIYRYIYMCLFVFIISFIYLYVYIQEMCLKTSMYQNSYFN